jgi:predicted small metal-binding protein
LIDYYTLYIRIVIEESSNLYNSTYKSYDDMTLSINCKDAGDPVCTHTMYGDTEDELIANAKKHGIEVHGYTEETWNEEMSKNMDNIKKFIKST